MKKIIFVLLAAMVLFASCGNGKLKAGVYEASNQLPDSTVTAKVTIDNETYKDSTKKTLGDAYGMFSDWGSKVGEWYQQAAALENAIIANQGTDFIKINSEGKTDAVSGCTIKVDHMIKVFNDALKKAK